MGNINETDNYKSIKNLLFYEWKKYNLLMKAFKSLSIDVLYFSGVNYFFLLKINIKVN